MDTIIEHHFLKKVFITLLQFHKLSPKIPVSV